MSGTHVVEFKSRGQYEKWLREWEGRVEVIDVSTTKNFGCLTGFLFSGKTFTVTYRGPADASPQDEAPSLLWFLVIFGFVALVILSQIHR